MADSVTPEKKSLVPVPLVVGLVVAGVLGGGVYALVRWSSARGEQSALTAEAKAYTRNLKLSDVGMKATASYVGQDLIEILGKIGNAGGRFSRWI